MALQDKTTCFFRWLRIPMLGVCTGLWLLSGCGKTEQRAPRKDYWRTPFRRIVIMGESTVEGGPWLEDRADRFADILVRRINAFQKKPALYFNKGIGSNVISPRSPGYAASKKPSALERYRADAVALKPDLFILCYGLNDMRAGMPVEAFAEDMESIIQDVQRACDPVIILTTVYHMAAYEAYAPFDRGGVEATERYNRAIASLAATNGCLLADVWRAMRRCDGMVHSDGVHANKIGNEIIANRIFETLAQHMLGDGLQK